jgi:hypothetical protein
MEHLILEIKRIANQNPQGFTISLPNLEHVKSGWIVALKETQNSFGDEGLKKVLETSLNTSNKLGGWKEGKDFYWDTVITFDTKEDAIRAGIENGQIAIYHIETASLIYL